jgi:hypothetical protein
MILSTPDAALAEFDRAISTATDADAAYAALQTLAETVVGVKLFTVMSVDMAAGLARRAYTNQPESYPVTGTKPIHRNAWFDTVHGDRRPFVANTIEQIACVFPDHELINSLGCQSVVNLPVVLRDELVATVNMLHETGFYSPERVDRAARHLCLPAKLAYLLATTGSSAR